MFITQIKTFPQSTAPKAIATHVFPRIDIKIKNLPKYLWRLVSGNGALRFAASAPCYANALQHPTVILRSLAPFEQYQG
ncbi:MAG: hypothetical protein F6K47_34380 [Symploca sp. SIO2E6]|nr:hypothetical protein [Symploca sp. SIO2E6]